MTTTPHPTRPPIQNPVGQWCGGMGGGVCGGGVVVWVCVAGFIGKKNNRSFRNYALARHPFVSWW